MVRLDTKHRDSVHGLGDVSRISIPTTATVLIVGFHARHDDSIFFDLRSNVLLSKSRTMDQRRHQVAGAYATASLAQAKLPSKLRTTKPTTTRYWMPITTTRVATPLLLSR